MTLPSLLTGFLLFTLTQGNALAAIYGDIKKNTEFGVGEIKAEEDVKGFVAKTFRKLYGPEWDILESDIDLALAQKKEKLCSKPAGKHPSNHPECTKFLEDLRDLAQEEERVRLLGRYLQSIATSDEYPIDSYPGRLINLPLHFRSIITIWQAGTGAVLSTSSSPGSASSMSSTGSGAATASDILLRLHGLPPDDDAVWQTIKREVFENIPGTAGVWRYRHGVRYLLDGSPDQRRAPFFPDPPAPPPFTPFPPEPNGPENGGGTERQYLFKRWDGFEEKLLNAYSYLRNYLIMNINAGNFKPPPRKGEIILFPGVKDDKNHLLWFFVEALQTIDTIPLPTDPDELKKLLTGDAGLHFDLAIEPVLPALLTNFVGHYPPGSATDCSTLPLDSDGNPWNTDCPKGLIPGGAYPPEPIRMVGTEEKPLDGLGLCMLPLPRFGYLCKPLRAKEGEVCKNKVTPLVAASSASSMKDSIVLARCEPFDTNVKETLVGPDACKELGWQIGKKGGGGSSSSISSSSSSDEFRVCGPYESAAFLNTIGNTMCYLGQCLEQNLEIHRWTGGRSPFTTEEQAFPWDFLTPLGLEPATFLDPPPLNQTTFLAYRPAALLRTLDAALCQPLGLPPTTPPTACMGEALRRLRLPGESYVDTAGDLGSQSLEQAHGYGSLQEITPGIGARVGTQVFLHYLEGAGRTFAQIVGIAADVFDEVNRIEFPPEMCPLGVP